MKWVLVVLSVSVCGACKGGAKPDGSDPGSAAAKGPPPSTETPEYKAAFARISELVKQGYGAWLRDNPTRECPHSFGDILQYATNKDPNDPWGHPYWLLCDTVKTPTLAVRIGSSGADGRPMSDDDPIGTYKLAAGTPITAPPTAPRAIAGDVISVRASDLAKQYKDDNITADDKYRNRSLLVTGQLESVGKDLLGMDDPPFVIFGKEPNEVAANIGDQAKAKNLKRGQTVTLRCTGGGNDAGAPLLTDCVLE